MQNPEVRAHLVQVRGKPGSDAAQKVAAFQQARDAEEKRLLADIVAEGEEKVDPTIVQLWQRWRGAVQEKIRVDGNPDKPAGKQLQGLMREMAERMGSLPVTGGKTGSGTNEEAIHFGYPARKGVSLSLHATVLRQLDRELPALAEWLGRQGCSYIRYGIDIPHSETDEETDEE